ncbi:protein TRC8 homolog isoform X2 [Mytilus californianus]|nr:protein TRC8 homolog isoform X2 [Mytilus californianus]
MSCCSVISVIAFSTISIVICKHLLKFCYFIVRGINESTEEELGLHILYIITVYVSTTDMIFFDMKPLDRGIFLSSRIVFLAACLLEACSIIVEIASAEVAAIQASGFNTLRVIGVHIAFCIGSVAILYGLLVQYSMKDLGIFLATSYFVCNFIRIFASLFIFCLYKFDEIRQEFWENFDDVIFYARMTFSTIIIVICMPTACVGVWTVFYGFYTWLDLYRLLAMCLVNVFIGIKVLLNTIRQRKWVMAYTTELEDASKSQLSSNDCSICLQEMMKGKVTRCGHLFHEICLRKWLNTRMVCPLCNTSILIHVQ